MIVRACAIGDFVVMLPALESLAQHRPGARFTLVGYPATVELARGRIPVEAIESIESPVWSGLFSSPAPSPLRFDEAFVWMRDPLLARNLAVSGVHRTWHLPPFPAAGLSVHATDHLLDGLGLTAPPVRDEWIGGSDLILHPGSGGPLKVWPYFEELAGRLTGCRILAGPAEADLPWLRNVVGSHRLPEVAALFREARAFVGCDSGMTHLAASTGCPTLAMFGPTDPRIWGPRGSRVRVLRADPLSGLDPDAVLRALDALLDEHPLPPVTGASG